MQRVAKQLLTWCIRSVSFNFSSHVFPISFISFSDSSKRSRKSSDFKLWSKKQKNLTKTDSPSKHGINWSTKTQKSQANFNALYSELVSKITDDADMQVISYSNYHDCHKNMGHDIFVEQFLHWTFNKWSQDKEHITPANTQI